MVLNEGLSTALRSGTKEVMFSTAAAAAALKPTASTARKLDEKKEKSDRTAFLASPSELDGRLRRSLEKCDYGLKDGHRRVL